MASLTVPVEFTLTSKSKAMLDFLRTLDMREEPAAPVASPQRTSTNPPKIGEAWPEHGGIYAGISRGEDGQPDAHLVLVDATPDGDLNWKAAMAWAEGLGNGARLPTRFEAALLYANLHDKVPTGDYYWTSTQSSDDYAWGQGFDSGNQSYYDKSYEARARAVRRLEI